MNGWDWAQQGPRNNQIWHEMLADLLILNPTATNEELAAQIGLHMSTVRAVRASDMFQAIVERRRDRIEGRVEETYMDKIQGKLGQLAEVAVDTVTEQLQRERQKMLDHVSEGSLETCEMALRSLGLINGRGGGGTPAPVQLSVVVNNTVLESAREKMRTLHANASRGDDGKEVEHSALLSAPAQLP